MGTLAETYRTAYECLVHEKPITCAVTGKVFGPVPVPAVSILDVCYHFLILQRRFQSEGGRPSSWRTLYFKPLEKFRDAPSRLRP